MRIKVSNVDDEEARDTAIRAALLKVNGAATSFTIFRAADVVAQAREALKRMEGDGMTRKMTAKALICYRPAGPAAKAYQYGAQSTRITLRVAADGKTVHLIDVEKVKVFPQQREENWIALTAESHAAWVRGVAQSYAILKDPVVAAAA